MVVYVLCVEEVVPYSVFIRCVVEVVRYGSFYSLCGRGGPI